MRGAALVILAACSSHGSSPPSNHTAGAQAIADEDDAIRAFQTAWEREVRPTIATRSDPLLHLIDDRMQTTDAMGLYHAEAQACANGVKLIEGLNRLGHDFVLHGTVSELRRSDRCWAVLFLGGMKIDVHGWLDLTGHLIVVWRIPEG